jgi:hypothetical protein
VIQPPNLISIKEDFSSDLGSSIRDDHIELAGISQWVGSAPMRFRFGPKETVGHRLAICCTAYVGMHRGKMSHYSLAPGP